MTGIEGILKAMEGNETLTNNSYREVVELHLPPDIKAQVELNFRDERRHVQYIEQKLTEKVWQAR
jgi:hypothetical protein